MRLKNKIFYCLPDVSMVFNSVIVFYYMIYFCTDVFLLPATVVSVLYFGFNVFDALNDCVIAYIMCRVRSKYGIYRPYLLWTALPLAVTSVLLFAAPPFSVTGKIVYLILVYMVWNVTYSFMSVAREALLPLMGKTESERISLNNIKIGFTIILMTIGTSYLMPLVNSIGGGDQRRGFFMTALILSSVALPFQLLAFIKLKEPEGVVQGSPISFWRAFSFIFKDKGAAALLLMYGFFWIGSTFRNQSVVHYLTYVLNRSDLISLFLFSSMGASIAMQFVIKKLVARTSPAKLTVMGLLGSITALLLVYWSGGTIPVLITANILYGAASALPANLIFIIIAGKVDELSQRGRMNFSSLLYSAMGFFAKVGKGIGGAALAAVLSLAGYQPNVAQQSAAVSGITFNYIGGASIGYLLAGLMLLVYMRRERSGGGA